MVMCVLRRWVVAPVIVVAVFSASCASSDESAVPASSQPTEVPVAEAVDAQVIVAESEDAANGDPGAGQQAESVDDPPEPRWVTEESEVLFDQSELHTFELTLSEENLAELDADPTAEKYVEGALHFDGETVAAVGIRYKGSVGAFFGCVDGGNLFEPSGAKACTKLSIKVKINWDDSDTTFYGVKKLQFHAMNLDPTLMRERLGYHLFGAMGVAAPRAVHSRLEINGEFVGVFVLVEQIDGRFTRQNFEDGRGNLYKEVWPVTVDGRAATDKALVDALKTNEDDDPSVALMAEFGEDVLQAGPEGAPGVVEKYMDVAEIMSYVVVDRAIRHDDGPFHLYCFEGSCAGHNYYWYEDPSAQRLHLVPWDLDNAFENITSRNPVTGIVDEFGDVSRGCSPGSSGGLVQQIPAACDPLIAAWASFEDERNQASLEFVDGPFADEEVDRLLTEWSEQISDAVAEADASHADAPSVEAWERSVQELRAAVDVSREKIVAQTGG